MHFQYIGPIITLHEMFASTIMTSCVQSFVLIFEDARRSHLVYTENHHHRQTDRQNFVSQYSTSRHAVDSVVSVAVRVNSTCDFFVYSPLIFGRMHIAHIRRAISGRGVYPPKGHGARFPPTLSLPPSYHPPPRLPFLLPLAVSLGRIRHGCLKWGSGGFSPGKIF